MHTRVVSFVAAFSAIAGAAPAMAAPLQPVTPWDVDYEPTQCTAGRSFGSESSPVILGIIPSLSGASYKLLVSVPRSGPIHAQESAGSVDFGAGAVNSGVLYYGGKAVKLSDYQFTVPAADLERAMSAPTVTLNTGTGEQYSFALSNMPALLAALRQCTSDLQQYWNQDTKPSTFARAAAGDVRSIFSPADYPTEALERQQGGISQYQLLIDENGAVAGCDLLRPSGVPILDVTGCEVIKQKAKFRPALNAKGTPVRSVLMTPPITWRPEDVAFNTGCTWNLGYAGMVLNTCQPSLPAHPMPIPTPQPSSPVPTPKSNGARS